MPEPQISKKKVIRKDFRKMSKSQLSILGTKPLVTVLLSSRPFKAPGKDEIEEEIQEAS